MKCECDNCGYVCDVSQLNKAKHLSQRLDFPIDDPRCVVPEGECPKCGALSYEIKPPKNKTPRQKKRSQGIPKKQVQVILPVGRGFFF